MRFRLIRKHFNGAAMAQGVQYGSQGLNSIFGYLGKNLEIKLEKAKMKYNADIADKTTELGIALAKASEEASKVGDKSNVASMAMLASVNNSKTLENLTEENKQNTPGYTQASTTTTPSVATTSSNPAAYTTAPTPTLKKELKETPEPTTSETTAATTPPAATTTTDVKTLAQMNTKTDPVGSTAISNTLVSEDVGKALEEAKKRNGAMNWSAIKEDGGKLKRRFNYVSFRR